MLRSWQKSTPKVALDTYHTHEPIVAIITCTRLSHKKGPKTDDGEDLQTPLLRNYFLTTLKFKYAVVEAKEKK